MPIDVTVDKPRPRIICLKPDDGRVVLELAKSDYVATDRILVVVFVGSGAADDRE